MGPELYGQYGLLMVWVTTVALLSRAGHELLLMREVPSLVDAGSHGRLRHLISETLAGVGRRLAVALIGLALVLFWWLDQPWLTTLICMAIASVTAVAGLVRFVGLAHSATWVAEGPESIARPLIVAGLIWWISSQASSHILDLALWATLGAALVSLAVAVAITLRFTTSNLLSHPAEEFLAADAASLARSSLALNVMQILLRNVDLVVVGFLCSPLETGLYLAASRVATIPTAVLTTLDPIFSPRIARVARNEQIRQLHLVTITYASIAASATLSLLLAYLLYGDLLVRSIFGDAYSDTSHILKILLCGHVLANLSGPLGTVFNMTGHHLSTLKIAAVSTLIMMSALAVLVPIAGPAGAAWAFLIASGAKAGLQAVTYIQIFALHPPWDTRPT